MRILLIILPLFLLANDCSKCSLNKSQMKCEYYVAKKGDISKKDYCKEYANYLDKTKVYGRASWYYLLSLEPKKAIETGKKALKMKENYANEYIAEGYLILKDKDRAKSYFKKIDNRFFVKKNLEILERLYKDFDKKEAMRLLSY